MKNNKVVYPRQITKSEIKTLIAWAKHEIKEWSKFQKALEKELRRLNK